MSLSPALHLARLVVLSWLAACFELTTPIDDRLLEFNRVKWEAAGIDSYDIEISTDCLCEATEGRVLIAVRSSAMTSRTVSPTGVPLPADQIQWFPDIPQLFDIIRNALDLPASSLLVRYDPTYGYPQEVHVVLVGSDPASNFRYVTQGLVNRE